MFDEFHYGAHGQFGAIFSYQNRPHAVDFPVADGSVPELIFIEVQIQIEGLDEGDEEVCQSAPWAGTESGLRCGILQCPGGGSLSSACKPIC